jgi:hypothetical protein
MVLIYLQDREIVGYEVGLYDVPGALKRVLDVFVKYNINLTYIERYSALPGTAYFFIGADFTNIDISPILVLEEIKKLTEHVSDAKIAPRIGDIIYSSKPHFKDVGGERAILLYLSNIRGFLNGIRDELGYDIGSSVIYRIGYTTGKESYNYYSERIKLKGISELIEFLKALFNASAWGYISSYDMKEDKIILRIEKSWECETMKGEIDSPASYYLRGFLAGFIEKYLGRKVGVKETKCIAVGDPYCEFNITI